MLWLRQDRDQRFRSGHCSRDIRTLHRRGKLPQHSSGIERPRYPLPWLELEPNAKALPRVDGFRYSGLTGGDPDLEPDEIQAAIDKAEQKRRELLETQPAATSNLRR